MTLPNIKTTDPNNFRVFKDNLRVTKDVVRC